jgi:ammonium transporter, Amt family
MNKLSFARVAPFVLLAVLAIGSLFVPSIASFDDKGTYNQADIAWIIVATALVFIMTPGLAFFYGGMVHRKNVLSTMIKSVVAAGVVSVLWVVVGYSLAFGDTIGGFIGNPSTHLFFKGVISDAPALQGGATMTIPLLFFLHPVYSALQSPGVCAACALDMASARFPC